MCLEDGARVRFAALVLVLAACRPPGYGKDGHPDAPPAGDGHPADGSGGAVDAAPMTSDAAAVCNHTFRLDGHGTAGTVYLTGDFVQWAAMPPGAVAFTLGTDGAWMVTYPFVQGTYQYKFIVDGNYILDPTNSMTVDDGMGHTNSVYTCVP
jgi:hypothetical protein